MKRLSWEVFLGLFLITLSTFLYFIHYLIFKDVHHIMIYFLGDVAFVPIEVLLVTLIIHKLLSEREKRARLKKLNMVIGAFFSEVGTQLLKYFSVLDPRIEEIRKELIGIKDYFEIDFTSLNKRLKDYDYKIKSNVRILEDLQIFLAGKKDFLLGLLENPNLLEHESFTDLLWSVFHLTEELIYRVNIRQLPETDYEHLASDIKKAYTLLVFEWLSYLKHLKDDYPYLFSLMVRTNPFDPDASPIVE